MQQICQHLHLSSRAEEKLHQLLMIGQFECNVLSRMDPRYQAPGIGQFMSRSLAVATAASNQERIAENYRERIQKQQLRIEKLIDQPKIEHQEPQIEENPAEDNSNEQEPVSDATTDYLDQILAQQCRIQHLLGTTSTETTTTSVKSCDNYEQRIPQID